ncbi:MAG TPA: PRC-barrel domain-containing protein [Pseudonocardiaceae bacterium]|jgi:sporulation protein YlmC with PRC-barrel domain|nr:PRC-barrel domain-containing protein [Pseudonocardiaceae bacterium]
MTNSVNPQVLLDAEVFDSTGERIGKVGEVYLRDDSRQPAWIVVRSGLFRANEAMVPLQGAHMYERGIQVDVSKDRILHAPQLIPERRLSEEDSVEICEHYGLRAEVPISRSSPEHRPFRIRRPGSVA